MQDEGGEDTDGGGGLSLRERARKRLRGTGLDYEAKLARLPQSEIARLFEELRIGQIELTIQYEELRAANRELKAAHDRYRELFEEAPVGYLILDARGGIREANRTSARLLGCARGSELVGTGVEDYVAPESQEAWYFFRRALQQHHPHPTGELQVRPADVAWRCLRLEAQREEQTTPGEIHFRCAVLELTERY